jgi:hypothetical protein
LIVEKSIVGTISRVVKVAERIFVSCVPRFVPIATVIIAITAQTVEAVVLTIVLIYVVLRNIVTAAYPSTKRNIETALWSMLPWVLVRPEPFFNHFPRLSKRK